MIMIDKNWSEKIVRGFECAENNSLSWVYAKSLKEAGALHGLSSRHGGVSTIPGLKSLNLGWNRPEERSNIKENYIRLADAVGFAYESMALVNYKHGDGIEIARSSDAGKGFSAEKGTFPECDALITRSKAITLITLHADCMPVFIFDPAKKISAMIHSGWKGTSMRIAAKAFRKMTDEFACRPDEILIGVGPSISQKHFEVDENVFLIFNEKFPNHQSVCGIDGASIVIFDEERKKYFIDLSAIMAMQLMEAGALAENMTFSESCTFEDAENFYSYRRDGKVCGAMAGFMRIEN